MILPLSRVKVEKPTLLKALRSAGFTLVEILVAASLLSIAIVAIVGMVRKAWDIEMDNLHRRQARTLIVNQLESQKYDYTSYSALYNECPTPHTDTTIVTIDPRGGNPLTGKLIIQLTRDAGLTITATNGGAKAIPRVIVNMTVQWEEPGYTDQVSIEKWISETL